MTIVFFLDIYYCIIIAWTLFYLINSFVAIPDLPWGSCGEEDTFTLTMKTFKLWKSFSRENSPWKNIDISCQRESDLYSIPDTGRRYIVYRFLVFCFNEKVCPFHRQLLELRGLLRRHDDERNQPDQLIKNACGRILGVRHGLFYHLDTKL